MYNDLINIKLIQFINNLWKYLAIKNVCLIKVTYL